MTDNLITDRAQTARVQFEYVRRELWAGWKQNIAIRLKKFFSEWKGKGVIKIEWTPISRCASKLGASVPSISHIAVLHTVSDVLGRVTQLVDCQRHSQSFFDYHPCEAVLPRIFHCGRREEVLQRNSKMYALKMITVHFLLLSSGKLKTKS
jgi:hypothetical protein